MKHIISIFFLFCSIVVYSQQEFNSKHSANNGDAALEKKKDLSKKIFVIGAVDDNNIYSVKFDSKNASGIRFWIKTTHTYKRIKNQNGEWVDYKPNDYTMALVNINCSVREYEVLKIINYDENNNVIDSNEAHGTIEYIVPESNMELFSKIICD